MEGKEPIERGAGNDEEMFISVGPSGMWYIPNRVYDRFFDGDPAVELWMDRDEATVEIVPTHGHVPSPEGPGNTYPLRDNRGYGRRFTSHHALTKLGVDLDETVRLDPQHSPDGDGVIVSLEEYV